MKETKIKLFNGETAVIRDTENYKALKSEDYNFYFNKKNGYFVRWGLGNYNDKIKKTINKEEMSLYLMWSSIWKEKFDIKEFIADLDTDGSLELGMPEIADIEISTSCHGVSIQGKKASPCQFCYKSNIPRKNGEGNMTLETFKKVFEKITKIETIGQIAFGITDIDANPDMWKIFEYTRKNGVIPNVTINGDRMTSELYDKLASVNGAVAVSVYDIDKSYNSIYELATVRGMKQINIHYMISSDRYETAIEIMKDIKTDYRLKDLNAIVFLSLKPKGKKNKETRLSDDKFKELVDYALDNNISMGFDSCSQVKFIKSIKNRPEYNQMEQSAESCESSIYSLYINSGEVDENGISDPKFYPCSFSENLKDAPGDWTNGISILKSDDFIKDVWFNDKVRKFHAVTVENKTKCVACPMYHI